MQPEKQANNPGVTTDVNTTGTKPGGKVKCSVNRTTDTEKSQKRNSITVLFILHLIGEVQVEGTPKSEWLKELRGRERGLD